MTEIWERTFSSNQLIWGLKPTRSAVKVAALFAAQGVSKVLIPGIGYGRNAKPFLEAGMSVSGIEIAETAIELARSKLGLRVPIHHGSVTQMPFDDQQYEGIFCHGLLYLLDAPSREKLLGDCYQQLAPGGVMAFTLITKDAPMFGKGTRLGPDWYEILPGMRLYFYDKSSARQALGGLCDAVELERLEEPTPGGGSFPFLLATVTRPG